MKEAVRSTPARAFTREALAHIAQLAAKVATGYVRIRITSGMPPSRL